MEFSLRGQKVAPGKFWNPNEVDWLSSAAQRTVARPPKKACCTPPAQPRKEWTPKVFWGIPRACRPTGTGDPSYAFLPRAARSARRRGWWVSIGRLSCGGGGRMLSSQGGSSNALVNLHAPRSVGSIISQGQSKKCTSVTLSAPTSTLALSG